MQDDFSQNQKISAEELQLKKSLSSALATKIDLLAKLYIEKRISLEEISQILGLDQKEVTLIFSQKGLVKKKKILVGGGAGFIGSNFIYHLLEKYPNYEIINYD